MAPQYRYHEQFHLCALGVWVFCDEKPNFNSSGFDLKARITQFKGKLLGDWRNTLEKRPEHVGDINEKVDPLNGYKWGVEYPTNGKRPNLDGDVVTTCYCNGEWRESKVWAINWPESSFRIVTKFRITDQRYKPAELAPTKPWFEAGELPPVGSTELDCKIKSRAYEQIKAFKVAAHENGKAIIVSYHVEREYWAEFEGYYKRPVNFTPYVISKPYFLPIEPIKTEREKAIDAAIDVICAGGYMSKDGSEPKRIAAALSDAGLLRLLDQK